MSGFRMHPAVFMVAYCVAYAFVFAKEWPLFRYYPLHGDFAWAPKTLSGVGPAMAWYGLMASAALIALIVTILVPQSFSERLSGSFLWVFPVGTMLVSVFLLRELLF
jgi:hypothetical protein